MRDNRLTVRINSPLAAAFAFPLNPANTPLYWDSIVKEETSEWPVGVGTVYRNVNKQGIWSTYTLTAYKENEMFEMTNEAGDYHVRWTYKAIDEKSTEIDYYEWMDSGELEEPFTMEILERVKAAMERT